MKSFLVASLYALLASTAAMAGPQVIGNGGDPGEIQFRDIANNIEQWIQTDQAQTLKLPSALSYPQYKSAMLLALKQYSISITDKTILVEGVEKTCQNSTANHSIICNSNKFEKMLKGDRSEAYQIVHHEIAGLAGIEIKSGGNSDYSISSQISESLYQETVSRLPVNNPGNL